MQNSWRIGVRDDVEVDAFNPILLFSHSSELLVTIGGLHQSERYISFELLRLVLRHQLFRCQLVTVTAHSQHLSVHSIHFEHLLFSLQHLQQLLLLRAVRCDVEKLIVGYSVLPRRELPLHVVLDFVSDVFDWRQSNSISGGLQGNG